MRIVLLIGSGGFIGSVLRYLSAQYIEKKHLSAYPFGTFAVNITGCFLIGILLALSHKNAMDQDWKMFLITGLCGGFTTFSAFSSETVELMHQGNSLLAFSYVALSIILGLLATVSGYALAKYI